MTRFPVAVALMAIFTVIIIIFDNFGNREPLGRMLAGLIVGAYLSFCVTIARETQGKSPAIVLQIIIALICASLAWFSEELRINLPMAIGAVLLILGNMVLWRKSRDNLHVWDFTHKIWTGAVFATVGSVIFTVGVFAIGAAMKSLFGVNMNDLIEHLILPLGLGFLAPLYWLSTAPRVDESYQELHDNPGFVSKAVAFMGTWLLSPLTLIYALILIAYGINIIVAGSLPKGEIAQLTTPFLLVGTLTWLVLEPPFIRTKALAKLFRSLWFPLSIPAALMLAISVGVRITEYGFTPERIALLLAVIWAIGLGIWFSFGPKAKRDIRLIPGTAAILLFLGTFFSGLLSVQNQKSRAVSGLIEAGVMTNEGVVRNKDDITIDNLQAAKKAKGSLTYLIRQDEDKVLRSLFSGAKNVPAFQKFNTADIFERLNLDDVVLDSRYNSGRSIIYDTKNSIDISGFQQLHGRYSFYAANNDNARQIAIFNDVQISSNGSIISFSQNGNSIAEFDVQAYVSDLQIIKDRFILDDPSIVILNSEDKKINLIIHSLNMWKVTNDEDPKTNINLDFSILTTGF
ncbi:DUF4153 domain-containing protein [Hellea balneolensis]|uniref:DUF4153 domain-containing protein n=1 Tax=Hellea balneolensis TaxID=287478 RepID=UPI00138AC444|nr:DUF4153 domain-containing protein [Hellea balneolensis]